MTTEDLEKKKKLLESRLRTYTLNEVFKEAQKEYLDTKSPLTTGIESFDNDLKGKLRGKVGAYIGYGGTKKSLLALTCAQRSSRRYKTNALYSTMEMPAIQLLERVFDMSDFSFDPFTRNSEYIEQIVKDRNNNLINEVEDFLKAAYGDSFIISQSSRMVAEDYENIIKSYNNRHETPLDILVVDGLSMMGGQGTETEVYTTNSGELKDLANSYNIYIPLICHLSKGATQHTREVQQFVRGSQKILDNIDFVIQCSLVTHPEGYLEEEVDYDKYKGYLRFINKRGTGNRINKIYDFDPNTLEIKESIDDPLMYKPVKQGKGFF